MSSMNKSQRQRRKSDGIAAMGLEKFLNKRYESKGGYDKYVALITAGEPDSVIAEAFGDEKPLFYQSVANWRKAYLSEREKIK